MQVEPVFDLYPSLRREALFFEAPLAAPFLPNPSCIFMLFVL